MQRSLDKMLSSVVFLDVQAVFNKNMVLIGFLIHPFLNRVSQVLLLESLLPGTQLSLKFSLEIISSQLLTKSSMRQLNIDTDQVDSLSAES